MNLPASDLWLKASLKETRRRAKAIMAHTEGYDLSGPGLRARRLAEIVLRQLENL
jgi:hypothetical protein